MVIALNKMKQVCEAAKARLTPNAAERSLVESIAEETKSAVERECHKAGLSFEVRVEGSVAKNTWIRNHGDIDIFMLVPPELSKEQLSKICLPIARRALGNHNIIERYAEHPFIETVLHKGGKLLRVNIVPCYHVEQGSWKSATDRSPYHTKYVNDRLETAKLDEVRLLKGFLQGIQAYGADIKTGGFSGMLAETLVMGYGKFLDTLKIISDWKESKYLDVENYYKNRQDEVRKMFTEPLVVIDPIDKGRNLGAAVHAEQLWNFVAAARHFLSKPSIKFFTQPKVKTLTRSEYGNIIQRRGSNLIAISFGNVDAVVDVLWGQLYRTQRALSSFLINNDFTPIRSAAWSNEHGINLILFELETSKLPASERHAGPPVSRTVESAAFLQKHLKDHRTVAGPWIENNRWIVQKHRSCTDAEQLLKSAFKSKPATIGVTSLLSKKNRTKIINQTEIIPMLKNQEFSQFIRLFLSGKPIWNV